MSGDAASRRGVRLPDETRLAWLQLIRSENVGPVTFRTLINRFGGAEAALAALPDLAARGGRRVRVASRGAAEEELARATRLGARFVCLGEPDYPALLRSFDQAPPVLAVMGDLETAQLPAVAMVGARNASLSGIKLTRTLASELGAAGYAVVSGLARGIDAAAHEAALDTGTIGVFAGGLDKPYPSEHRPLMRRIVDGGGCLVSEMPFGWEPRAIDFPRRNRLVAGLCLGLVVVEAAMRSGSLISARLAAEMGRLVFAVPGSPLDPRAAGTNRLLKDGATLVTEAADIIAALRPLDERMRSDDVALEEPGGHEPPDEPAQGERERIVETLGPTPIAVDDIIAHTGARPGAVQLVLLELDLAGRLERHADGKVSLLL
ncbi:MAG: DNA-processing protein DprA [Aurantimonas endophytica]|uniref:DNA processing protein n=1 Tax=Aurantimonas endophytica TaxID=1522175 RepID=A0A7W6MNA4_9HYPH|nr:DNA-processing protein DprA [Aurantimonas endophytica]MBB4001683.1 DNA processing protein [Aurantimonas endophytica]MCO6402680.1 DNA-protecting protein DprA [Aurantimonas endophytica]